MRRLLSGGAGRPRSDRRLGAGAWVYSCVERPYKGYADAEEFVEIVPGSNPQHDGPRARRRRRRPNATAFQAWRCGSAGRPPPAGGEYRFDAPMTPARRRRQDRARRRILQPITFREGLTIRQMAAVFEERGFGAAAEFIARRGEGRPRPGARSAGAGPRGLPLSRHLHAAAPHDRGAARGADGRALREGVDPRDSRQAAARGLSVRELVTLASLVEKETGEAGRASAGRRRLRESPEDRHGAAVRSDGDLRARARRPLRRQPDARRSAVRLAVQHLPLCRPAAGPDRRARPRVARGRRQPADVPYLYFVSRNDGISRVRDHARRAQPQRPPVPGPVFRSDGRRRDSSVGNWRIGEVCNSERKLGFPDYSQFPNCGV